MVRNFIIPAADILFCMIKLFALRMEYKDEWLDIKWQIGVISV